jgi:hypothetical protein
MTFKFLGASFTLKKILYKTSLKVEGLNENLQKWLSKVVFDSS